MELDEAQLYSDVITAYRQRLDAATFELERALAQAAQKDRRIAELEAKLEPYEAERASRPKPGKPPVR